MVPGEAGLRFQQTAGIQTALQLNLVTLYSWFAREGGVIFNRTFFHLKANSDSVFVVSRRPQKAASVECQDVDTRTAMTGYRSFSVFLSLSHSL